jgi:hypothetical protein
MRGATQIPELAGPGSADESGLVTYGHFPSASPTATRLPDAPPEALGPAVETSGGGFAYGVPGYQPGPMPVPTFEEREAERELREALIDNCECSPIPGHLISYLADLARQARLAVREGTGCPRCRAVPQRLVEALADAIEQAGAKR